MRRFNLSVAFIFASIGMAIIVWFIFRGLYVEKFIIPSGLINLTDAGLVGDFIGALLAWYLPLLV